MTRTPTTLIALTVVAYLFPTEASADANLDNLKSRIIAIESRLAALEEAMNGDETPSYTYQEQATLEATGNAPVPPVPPAPAAAPTASTTYVIRDGDTLGSIARDHGVERASLLEANRLSEGQPIYIGETLLIPGSAPAPAPEQTVAEADKPAPATEKSVVVGETRPSPPAPAPPVSGENSPAGTHTVVKGDTLTKISEKFGTTVAALKSANGLESDVISLGQSLTIPASGKKKVANAAPAPAAPAASGQKASYEYENPLLESSETYGYYTVKSGDNLYALARDFFTNMAELQRLNRLGDSTLIYPGNELIVPTSKYNAYHEKDGMAQR